MPSLSKPKKRKEKSPPEPYWTELVQTYFSFCRNHFHEEPSFDGSAPRDLKNIATALRKRSELKGWTWTERDASQRLYLFLQECYKDTWLRNNFLLQNINRQKDKIFFNAANAVHPNLTR